MTPEGFRALRYRYNLPQVELAEALGVSRTKIVELEQGRCKPGRLLLLALAAWVEGLDPYESNPADLEAISDRRPLRIGGRTDRRAGGPSGRVAQRFSA